jgi:hypothetical protein
MNTKNENGSVLLEAVVATFLCLAFAAGAAALHRSYHARYERILHHRNEEIARLRKAAEADTFLPSFLSVFGDGGNYGAGK